MPIMNMDFGITLGTSKVLDACKLSLRNPVQYTGRQGATTEAYEQYAAGRSERSQHSREYTKELNNLYIQVAV